MATYTKIMGEKELTFTVVASCEGIAPKVISWNQEGNHYICEMVRYPLVLRETPNWRLYQEKIVALITQLHSIGVLHGDISEENIVIGSDDDVRLIDFGLSRWITNLTEKDLESSYEEPADSVAELLQIELDEVGWLCVKQPRSDKKEEYTELEKIAMSTHLEATVPKLGNI